jgi:uncharacterized membrane protein
MSTSSGDEFRSAVWRGFPYLDQVKRVPSDAPYLWLAAGWRDFKTAPLISLFFGALLAGLSLFLSLGLYLMDKAWMIPPALGGFLILGPVLSVGMYEVSRQLEAGRKPGFVEVVLAWKRNPWGILGGGVALALYFVVWMRAAAVIFAIFFPYESANPQSLVNQAFFTLDGWFFFAVGTGIGAVFAAGAFLCSAVSLQMMLDRRADVFRGVMASIVAVIANLKAMMIWAALIVMFVGAGVMTGFLGFLIVLPLIGHASWHAYRGVLKTREELERGY